MAAAAVQAARKLAVNAERRRAAAVVRVAAISCRLRVFWLPAATRVRRGLLIDCAVRLGLLSGDARLTYRRLLGEAPMMVATARMELDLAARVKLAP